MREEPWIIHAFLRKRAMTREVMPSTDDEPITNLTALSVAPGMTRASMERRGSSGMRSKKKDTHPLRGHPKKYRKMVQSRLPTKKAVLSDTSSG